MIAKLVNKTSIATGNITKVVRWAYKANTSGQQT